jgi:hypothetical protein
LPNGGGLLDQEYGLLDRMDFVRRIVIAYQALGKNTRNRNIQQWADDHPDSWDLYKWVEAKRNNGN